MTDPTATVPSTQDDSVTTLEKALGGIPPVSPELPVAPETPVATPDAEGAEQQRVQNLMEQARVADERAIEEKQAELNALIHPPEQTDQPPEAPATVPPTQGSEDDTGNRILQIDRMKI